MAILAILGLALLLVVLYLSVVSPTDSGRRIALNTPLTILSLCGIGLRMQLNTMQLKETIHDVSPNRIWGRIADIGLKNASHVIGGVDVYAFFTSSGPNSRHLAFSVP
jgi:hypothetical protein